ncbi:hypothetical protein JOF56_008218 [Kibdelosporangium banguiense]|uniref:HAMP domain-containing protein n=1 Tax=Kibdelosporangium banguiense TaxID=1365924 RepID=A0ABS4TV69_9PSEU|nr:cache domain-containing protein [Kibdelosporangium banguiense]MBP2327833.1 hypothetical protein [Kibdelosporangium banguiense]
MTVRVGRHHKSAPDTDVPPSGETSLGRYFPVAVAMWALGAVAFLVLAVTTATAPSSWLVEDIPDSVAAEQQARTALAARQLQRSLDSGVSDLASVAAGIRVLNDETPNRLLSQLVSTRNRYRGTAYLAPTGEIRAKAGEDIDTTVITTTDKPALAAAAAQGISPRVFVSVPVTGPRAGRLVAEFKPEALIRPLSLAGPGNTRLLNKERKVIGATTGFTAFEPLTRPDLDQAAQSAATQGAGSAVRDVDGQRHVVSWAPVTSKEATRQIGLAVVTDRPETALTLPHSSEKRELLLLGVLIAAITVVIFGWLYAVIISPLSALAKAAGQIARGHTDDAVIVRRYDHLGLIARDLELLRRGLLRRS